MPLILKLDGFSLKKKLSLRFKLDLKGFNNNYHNNSLFNTDNQ